MASKLWKLEVGDKIETNEEYAIMTIMHNIEQEALAKKLLITNPFPAKPVYMKGVVMLVEPRNDRTSLIRFQNEKTRQLVSIDEAWVQPEKEKIPNQYRGKTYEESRPTVSNSAFNNKPKMSNTTIDDILKKHKK